ncbi:hypothetical protein [Azospirillum endophyticum]
MAAAQTSVEAAEGGRLTQPHRNRQKREGGVQMRRGHALCTPADPGRDV